jgi:ABC-type Mn2+/Zn2+ transport system permease subunit
MSALWHWVADPYGYDFMRRALAASLLVGALAPLVGSWIVLRRLAYVGDAMSHATVGGVAVAYATGISLTLGAVGAGLLMAALMAALAAHPRLREDAVVGVVEVALFAGGLLVIARTDSGGVDLSHVLLGSIATVTAADLRLNAALAALALLVLVALFDDLRSATFDPLHARLCGVRVGPLRHGLFALLAVTVVLSLQTVGLLLSVALLIVPAAAARLWARTVAAMSLLAAAIGVLCALLGLTISFHATTPPGATIALCTVAVLAASWAATLPRRAHATAHHAVELAAHRPS